MVLAERRASMDSLYPVSFTTCLDLQLQLQYPFGERSATPSVLTRHSSFPLIPSTLRAESLSLPQPCDKYSLVFLYVVQASDYEVLIRK